MALYGGYAVFELFSKIIVSYCRIYRFKAEYTGLPVLEPTLLTVTYGIPLSGL